MCNIWEGKSQAFQMKTYNSRFVERITGRGGVQESHTPPRSLSVGVAFLEPGLSLQGSQISRAASPGGGWPFPLAFSAFSARFHESLGSQVTTLGRQILGRGAQWIHHQEQTLKATVIQ